MTSNHQHHSDAASAASVAASITKTLTPAIAPQDAQRLGTTPPGPSPSFLNSDLPLEVKLDLLEARFTQPLAASAAAAAKGEINHMRHTDEPYPTGGAPMTTASQHSFGFDTPSSSLAHLPAAGKEPDQHKEPHNNSPLSVPSQRFKNPKRNDPVAAVHRHLAKVEQQQQQQKQEQQHDKAGTAVFATSSRSGLPPDLSQSQSSSAAVSLHASSASSSSAASCLSTGSVATRITSHMRSIPNHPDARGHAVTVVRESPPTQRTPPPPAVSSHPTVRVFLCQFSCPDNFHRLTCQHSYF